ncbi:MAG: leucyl aminopeptidase family protein, partial [Pseudomonadota bacterium]
MIIARREAGRAIPVHGLLKGETTAYLAELSEAHRTFAERNGFDGATGKILALPASDGEISAVLLGLGDEPDPFAIAALNRFRDGTFALGDGWADPTSSALGFLLGLYRFDNYRASTPRDVKLLEPDGVDIGDVNRVASSVSLTRDLINTPANDLGPAELADAAQALGRKYGAAVTITDGEDLETGFPMIAAVGAASSRPPLLIDLVWGEADAPKLTLVGKGV